MAARENQGLHIALILFVMLTVLLAVLCYFTFTSMNEMSDRLANAESERDEQMKLADAHDIESDVLKMWIGFGNMTPEEAEGQLQELARKSPEIASEMEAIRGEYEQDMQLFDSAYTGIRNYRALPSQLELTITKKNESISNGNRTEEELTQKMTSEIAAAIEAQKVAETKAADFQQDLNTEKETFRTTAQQIQQEQDNSVASVTAARDAEKTTLDEKNRVISERDAEIAQLETTLAEKATELDKFTEQTFDVADGKISDISARTGIVWINVGFEDNLPPNATFSVYPQDASQFRPEGIKGAIEVKRILGAHIAEARITTESVSDPIMPGDMINTSTWSPGQKQKFAISGFIDIDGDGQSDAARLRSIITRNGGEVVSYIDDEGNTQGELTATTRYLITGDNYPFGSMEETIIDRSESSTKEMKERAKEEVVEMKHFQELLEEIGFRGVREEVLIGPTGEPEFAPRRPPSRGNDGGAY